MKAIIKFLLVIEVKVEVRLCEIEGFLLIL